jgi:branched-chain amino acid transport system substrate-binding protein
MLRSLRLFARVSAACLLLGCGGAADPIVLGAAGPWKEGYGEMNRRGVELAVAEINREGGIRGRPLQVQMRDDDGDGAKAAAIAGDFVGDPKVLAVVGHVNSSAMMAAARIYDGNLPAVATTATSPDLSGVSRWVFRVISSDSTNGQDLAKFAHRLGRRRAAILYENNSYGRGLTEAFQRHFVGRVLSADPIDAVRTDFEPYISYLRLSRPDIIFVAGTEASGVQILREARRQGLEADFLGGDGWTGVVADVAASEGAYVGSPFTSADPRPEVQRFVKAFREHHQREPDGNAALAYDATRLIARAIIATGPDRAEIRDYLAGLGMRGAYRGVTGKIAFRRDGDPVGKGFIMTRVRRGSLDVVAFK